MIQTFSTTIRRKEMDAVLTCMVDERIGPGELNGRFIQTIKEFFGCDGAVALRNPSQALKYAFRSMDIAPGESVMISALAPAWHYQSLEDLGYKPVVLDVDENTGLVTAEIVKKGIEEGGRVLILHESMGILPEIDEILELGVPVIEDVSKSAGSYFPTFDENHNPVDGRKAGSCGVYSILALEERDVITAGGGAVLMAPNRREWIVLKKYVDEMSRIELLPDIRQMFCRDTAAVVCYGNVDKSVFYFYRYADGAALVCIFQFRQGRKAALLFRSAYGLKKTCCTATGLSI